MDKRIKRDVKMMKYLVILFLLSSVEASAITFEKAITVLGTHESVDSVNFKSKALSEEAELKGSYPTQITSWAEPGVYPINDCHPWISLFLSIKLNNISCSFALKVWNLWAISIAGILFKIFLLTS